MRIYFKDDPSLQKEIITTKSGVKEYRENCRRIESDYFIIDKEVFCISGRWYRPELKSIVFDHGRKEWIHKSKAAKLLSGIVSFDEKGNFTEGLFSRNPYKNCLIYDGRLGNRTCMCPEIIPEAFYTECIRDGMYYNIKDMSKKDASSKQNDGRNANNHYSIDDNEGEFNSLKKLFAESPLSVTKSDVMLAKAIGDYTYGLELEASFGNIPQNLRNKHGIYICRDGSLRKGDGTNGPEFVTVPLQGPKGIRNVKLFTKELSKRCIIGTECSYHLHIGGVRKDREFLIAMYKLASKIQNEVFTLFPFYKTDEVKLAGKEKNYAKKLKGLIPPPSKFLNGDTFDRETYQNYINDSYKILFTFLLEGGAPSVYNNRKNKQHPKDRKWERNSRYYWINFMNMFFSSRNTIEYRLHTPTLNSQKIL